MRSTVQERSCYNDDTNLSFSRIKLPRQRGTAANRDTSICFHAMWKLWHECFKHSFNHLRYLGPAPAMARFMNGLNEKRKKKTNPVSICGANRKPEKTFRKVRSVQVLLTKRQERTRSVIIKGSRGFAWKRKAQEKMQQIINNCFNISYSLLLLVLKLFFRE